MISTKKEVKKKRNRNKIKYLICKTTPELRGRIEKGAKRENRSMSNLINMIVEEWLNEKEIR